MSDQEHEMARYRDYEPRRLSPEYIALLRHYDPSQDLTLPGIDAISLAAEISVYRDLLSGVIERLEAVYESNDSPFVREVLAVVLTDLREAVGP